ncbi:MAG: hypothetical protein JW795_19735 [Chitinivibrionales bacterium]|nr:hypothetical protein [Chitinivibrionales bacterium]
MPNLGKVRCTNHTEREAVARCLSCGNFFCRECVTEHDGQLMCAGCIRSGPSNATIHKNRFGALMGYGFYCSIALCLTWLFFFSIGSALLRLPSSFQTMLWQR